MLSVYTYREDRRVPGWKKLNRVIDTAVYVLGFFQFWMALRLLAANVKAFQLFYAYTCSIIVSSLLADAVLDVAPGNTLIHLEKLRSRQRTPDNSASKWSREEVASV